MNYAFNLVLILSKILNDEDDFMLEFYKQMKLSQRFLQRIKAD